MIEYATELIEEIQRLKPTDAISIKVNGYDIIRVVYEGSHIDISTYENSEDLLQRIVELEDENYDLESENDDLECERDNIEGERDNIEGELEELQKTNEDLIEQRDFHLNRIKDLELENEKLKTKIKRLQEQIETDGDKLF